VYRPGANATTQRGRPLLLLLIGVMGGCTVPDPGDPFRYAGGDSFERSPAFCVLHSPVDLSSDLVDPLPSIYVNELRLGYARGGAIFLSRPLCDVYGKPLCRFVEAHEQAHHYTKTVGEQSLCAETLADCWAALHSDAEAVGAALEFFRSRQDDGDYHGNPNVRAEVISLCVRGKLSQSGTTSAPPRLQSARDEPGASAQGPVRRDN
jgi:hypothetical protein